MRTAIWWIRRDLRLSDNPALTAAAQSADVVVPVFIFDPKILNSPRSSQKRTTFLTEGLHSLDSDLRKRGSSLVLRNGDPFEVLKEICAETQAGGIYALEDVSPYAIRRDESVRRELPLKLMAGHTIHAPQEMCKPDGTPYRVFTPFSRRWHSLPRPGKPLAAPPGLSSPPPLQSLELPSWQFPERSRIFRSGEIEAQQRLESFIETSIDQYTNRRDRLDLGGTSSLSPYLRFGMISARQAFWMAEEAYASADRVEARHGVETWINELVWREFYVSILCHFPQVLTRSFRPEMDELQWCGDEAGFTAWKEGNTGYPIIDAAMRQLNATGWMHNRARMIVASFLVKDLLVDWRKGERYFMQQLIDGDPASNNGGWQWIAGTGSDAAPFFRIFNPVLQARKFDPQGDYIRRWLPELAWVPGEYIHAPWTMPQNIQIQAGCEISRDYPEPIIDHSFARERAINYYRSINQIRNKEEMQ